MMKHLAKMFVFSFILMTMSTGIVGNAPESLAVNITFIDDAEAVCLDGSPGAYFYDKGFGDGANNLIIYLEGGGWCFDEEDCIARSNTTILEKPSGGIGSNRNRTLANFQTILSPYIYINPEFYNWHRVYVSYCDGASFMADIEQPKSNLFLRGARIFRAAIQEVIQKGDIDVNEAILMGESAGGLAALLNCDRFRGFLPLANTVKCISDSGFFIDTSYNVRKFVQTNEFHELANVLPSSCTARMNSSLCLLPQNFVGDIETPVFILNSAFDSFQIQMSDPPIGVDKKHWQTCAYSFPTCTAYEFQAIRDFGPTLLEKFNSVPYNPSRGIFISPCYLHDFLNKGKQFWVTSNLTIQNQTIASVIGDWFFRKFPVRLINVTDAPVICDF